MASTKSFWTEDRGNYDVLHGQVVSGRPDAGKGFFHAIFDVPALFSLRALLESPWEMKPSQSGPCTHLANEMKGASEKRENQVA